MSVFSFPRFAAVVAKEFVQMRRDRLTFAMIIGLPLIQLVLFGYAINSDPRHLPTAVLSADNSVFSRSIISAMRTSSYFEIDETLTSREQAVRQLALGRTQFVVTIPENFGRDLARGDRPTLLIEADATDPSATSNAISAMREAVSQALSRDLRGPLSDLAPTAFPVDIRIHADYNPEARTEYNIVPGLMGVILTLTLVIITAMAMTRERERGTMENLLATPIRPLEVMIGKIIPYILVGYVQMLLIVGAARFLFEVPFAGSVPLVFAVSVLFIAANLAVGLTFSTVARTQLQAMQLSIFFFLPSLLLSGFMFPFRGMPGWAQVIGQVLPLTHYLRIVRGILLKGNGPSEIWSEAWPIAAFLVGVILIGLTRYRRTLD